MDNYYERLNQAFANWNGGGEPSLEQRVENLEAEIIQKQDILTFDTEPVEDSKNPVTSGGLFSQFERYATKTALDEKVDTSNFTADQERQDAREAEDRVALIQQVDSGAKNKVDATTHTTTGSDFVLEYVAISLPAGSYAFSYTSDQLTAGDMQLVIRNGKTVLGRYTITSQSGRNAISFSIDSDADNLRLYTVSAGTYSDFMLCTAADYAISTAFAPYRPTWQEMYDMIKALQSGS